MRNKPVLSNIVLLGLVSFFIDMSSEMVYPLVPLYLTAVLGATPAMIGVIEGVAESAAAFLKVFSGYIGDAYQNKKRLAFAGYFTAIIYKLLLITAASWAGILAARVFDRIGKGIRTAPRDAMVAAASHDSRLGSSFGLHKMLDMAGSAGGAALALLFLWSGLGYNRAFWLSIIPAVLGVLIIFGVREKRLPIQKRPRLTFRNLRLDKQLKRYLLIVFLFGLGNSSNAFLLLKARDIGFSTVEVIALYLLYNLSCSALAFPAGKLSDRMGRSRLLVPGYALYGLVYLGLALTTSRLAVLLLFVGYGAHMALISGAERAWIVRQAPQAYCGTILGLYGMVQGLSLLIASILAGGLWVLWGAGAPFLLGGAIGLGCAAAVAWILRHPPAAPTIQQSF